MNRLGVHALVRVGGWSHEEAARAIGQSAELGYDIIETPTEDGIARSVGGLQKVCDVAARGGIGVGLEVVNRCETNIANTAAQGVELCKRGGAPDIKVHLDCHHVNIEEADVERAIVETGDDLSYLHTGKSRRGYLGTGSIYFKKIFRGFAKANYQGPITFEAFPSTETGQPLTGILGVWRDPWTDGHDLCRDARKFTLTQIEAAAEAQSRSAGLGAWEG